MNDKALTMITTFDHTYLFFDKKKKDYLLALFFPGRPLNPGQAGLPNPELKHHPKANKFIIIICFIICHII